ncbi:MFS transporter [Pragia fontium]|uniref:Sugar phosphate permease n=2 Tax=Pragia fontium TaxID=82985 RepID=A0AAJ5BIQ0_9GAMM|nr:MFS transporter [Pragia fontium]GKX64702.1 MFS transporter [Pragia fontium]SFD46100.1 Sugar phosphate permease [Pragia fontium DSM 5563 = ATCC 49100]VEJ53227.1 D-glucarate permease [Pragia fontium]
MKVTNKYLMIFLLFIGYVIVYIDKTVIGFALLPIEQEFSLTAKELGYITGLFFLSYSLFQIPAGWLNDRIGYKKVLLLSLFLLGGFAISFGLLGLTFGLLVVWRFLAGIAHSGYPCSCAKAVVANFDVQQRTFAQSILLSSSGLAMSAGPVVAVFLISEIGWRGSFTWLGLFAFAIAFCVLIWVPKPAQGPRSAKAVGWSDYKQLLKNPVVLLLFVAIFGLNVPSYGLMAWLPKYLVQYRGLSISLSATIAAAGGLGLWVSSLCTGWFVGKYMQDREYIVISAGSLLGAVCIMAIYLVPSAIFAAILLFFGYVFLMAAFVTVFTLPMKRLPQEVIGAAMGMINTGGTLGGFVAPIAIGYLVSMTNSFASAFIFLAAAMVVSGLVVIPLRNSGTATGAVVGNE